MSKFAENVIKFAYENRANAMIAAKQAADEKGLIEKISAWLERNPQAKRGLISGGVAGLSSAAAYGTTRALGGSKGKAWTAAGITAPVAGGISEAALNRKEIGDFLKKLLYGKHEPLTTKSPILPSEKKFVQKAEDEGAKGNVYGNAAANIFKGKSGQSSVAEGKARRELMDQINNPTSQMTPEEMAAMLKGATGSTQNKQWDQNWAPAK